MKTAVVIGSTGLVGTELVSQLQDSDAYGKIILLNRRASGFSFSKVEEKIINFDAPDLGGIQAEDVFCAIGTTIKKAGSQAVQFKIDCEYPTTLAALLRSQGAKRFVLVSSIGADPDSQSFYLRTKAQLEKNLATLQYEATVILRPSFLVGKRQEFRFGEKAGIVLMTILSPLLQGIFKKYRGIKASKVAARMVTVANSGQSGYQVLESDQI